MSISLSSPLSAFASTLQGLLLISVLTDIYEEGESHSVEEDQHTSRGKICCVKLVKLLAVQI